MTELSPFETIGAALEVMGGQYPSSEAIAFPISGGRMTFAEWDLAATALARGLLDLGLRPGDHLGLLAENRVEWLVVQVAAARAGLVLVPLNTYYRLEELGYALKQSESRGLVLSRSFRSNRYLDMMESLRGELPTLESLILLDGSRDGYTGYRDLIERGQRLSTPLPRVKPDDIAVLMYTSGTTGVPKGALLTHLGMLADAYGIAQRVRMRHGDRMAPIPPLFHCSGCGMSVLGPLQMGACYVGITAFEPVEMFRLIESERVTVHYCVPTTVLAMLNHPERGKFNLSSLRTGICGSALVDPALLHRCAEEFPMPGAVNGYGQTEACTLICCGDMEDSDRFDTAGLPLPGLEVRVTDLKTGVPLKPGAEGQIEARGPMVMRGYFKMPEATRETLTNDGWLKTGDLGYLRPDGKLVVTAGRLKDMIIRGGENVYPVEVEMVLARHPAVAEAAVFGIRDSYYGEIVAAAVRCKGPVRAAELTEFCSQRLARFKVPAIYYAVEGFPLTANGKIRKAELRHMAQNTLLKSLL